MEDVELHKNLLYLQSNDLDMRKFIAAIILLLMPFVSFGRINKDINGLELGTTNLYDAERLKHLLITFLLQGLIGIRLYLHLRMVNWLDFKWMLIIIL